MKEIYSTSTLPQKLVDSALILESIDNDTFMEAYESVMKLMKSPNIKNQNYNSHKNLLIPSSRKEV